MTIENMKAVEIRPVSIDEALTLLNTSRTGLSSGDVQQRLQQYGPNELSEKHTSAIQQFLSYFWGTIPLMILTAAILSIILGHYITFGIITVLLLVNAFVGFHEERQAGDAIAALKKRLAVQTNVKRDNVWNRINATGIVPGDIIRLRLGSIISADAKLLEGDRVLVDESSLTGESMPVEHTQGDIVYSGSILKQGEIDAVVFATGQNTFYGKTAQLVQSAQTKSHLQKAIMKMADFLLVIAVILAVTIVTITVIRGSPFLHVLQFVLVLVVAAVPVAMPAVLSITMALGARKLAQKKAIVTKLSSIEEVAGVDVLCSDKTGTLTQAKLTPGIPFTIANISPDEVLLCGALSSREEDQDPIDNAIFSGVKDKETLKSFRVLHFTPFDPVHKRTEALITGDDKKKFRVSKGAPQVIMALDTAISDKNGAVNAISEFAVKGFRSIGVARSDTAGIWHFIGVIPLYDPLREDTKTTVDTAKKLGLSIKMITGDQAAIGKEIARQLDIGTNILNASIFDEAKPHQIGILADLIENADGFAQVYPEHKYHIVDVLQKRGHIVGMTGDGVNDAPALKKADAGIAVSGATDAARSAASIALLNPGLSVIIDAIRESRRIFERMLSYAVYRIAETIALLGFIAIITLTFNIFPVTPIMIVFLAILNDGSILSIAYDNTHSASLPLRWRMSFVIGLSSALGLYAVARSIGIYFLSLDLLHLDLNTLKTMIYLNLSVGGILTLYAARTRGPFWSVAPAKPLVIITFSAQIIATFLAVYGILMSPIGWLNAGIVWGYSIVLFIFQDFVKLGARRIFSEEQSGYFGKHTKEPR